MPGARQEQQPGRVLERLANFAARGVVSPVLPVRCCTMKIMACNLVCHFNPLLHHSSAMGSIMINRINRHCIEWLHDVCVSTAVGRKLINIIGPNLLDDTFPFVGFKSSKACLAKVSKYVLKKKTVLAKLICFPTWTTGWMSCWFSHLESGQQHLRKLWNLAAIPRSSLSDFYVVFPGKLQSGKCET